MKIKFMRLKITLTLPFIFFMIAVCQSQTELDAIMMNKTQFCNGLQYAHSSWKNYWEGELKRENLNLGTVTTQSVMYMANYGITDNLNVMVGAPYIWTKPSAGNMSGMNGIQDISAFVKWRAYQKKIGKGKLSLYAIGGISTPLSDYVIDFLPFSIGLGTTNLTARGMADYLIGKINITGSAAYISRGNAELDRNSYYDTELRLTNEINMPDAAQYQLRAGYRGKYLIAEGLLTNWTTLGGFDITRNNMPFPSNKMNNTTVGAYVKYTIKQHTNLAILGSANFTVAGRNMGQANTYSAGAFYAFYFGKNHKK
jgi:hypothetical protein